MFSHALQLYQENMIKFWQKTDRASEMAVHAIEDRNFKKKPKEASDVKETESSISLELEKSVSDTDIDAVKEPGEPGNLVDFEDEVQIPEVPESPTTLKDAAGDLLGGLEESKEAGNDDMDELFRKFSESRLKDLEAAPPKPVSSLDSQFDAIFGIETTSSASAPRASEGAVASASAADEEFRSIFEARAGDLLTSDDYDPMGFLPSQLLDQNSAGDWLAADKAQEKPKEEKSPDKKPAEKSALSWFNTFAELDPLADDAKIFAGEQA